MLSHWFLVLVLSNLTLAINVEHAFFRLVLDMNSLLEKCQFNDTIQNPANSEVECILFCSREDKRNAHFDHSGGNCICTNKDCDFSDVHDLYRKVKKHKSSRSSRHGRALPNFRIIFFSLQCICYRSKTKNRPS